MRQVLQMVQEGQRPPLPERCPAVILKLIQDCWQQDHQERPSFHDIIEILQPHEKRNDWSSPLSMYEAPPDSFSVFSEPDIGDFAYQETGDDWSMFNDDTDLVCKCWEMLVIAPLKRKAVEFISYHTREMRGFSSGSLCLRDNYGRVLWIVGLRSLSGLYQEEQYVKKQEETILRFTSHLCAPITRQTMRITPFSLRPGATHASVTHLEVQDGLSTESIKLYQQSCHSLFKDHLESWCGTLVLTDNEGTAVIIVTLFNDQDQLRQLEEEGYHHKQMRLFYNVMVGLPVFQCFSIHLDTLVTRSKIFPSSSSPRVSKSLTKPESAQDSLDLTEPVLDSFFCLLQINEEKSGGHLFVCTEHLRYKGRVKVRGNSVLSHFLTEKKLLGKERIFSIHLRNIISVDENRPFGRKGHTLGITTRSGKSLTLRSLLQREKLLRLISQQVEKLKPSHTILQLVNGEPNIFT